MRACVHTHRWWYTVVAVAHVLTINGGPPAALAEECPPASSFDPARDYFPHKVVPDHAEDFNVTYHNFYKVVENIRAGETYVLTYCDFDPPTDVPGVENPKFLRTPVTSAAVDSGVVATYFELLGERQVVKYMDFAFVVSPCYNRLHEMDEVVQLFNTSVEERKDQIAEVDVLLSGLFADPNADPDELAKTVFFSASSDPGSLHRVEWIYFLSAFLNTEEHANAIFDRIDDRYNCEIGEIHRVMMRESPVPVLAWLSFFDGTWTVSVADYQQSLTRNAGGVPLVPEVTDYTDVNELHSALGGVDVLIDLSADFLSREAFTDAFGATDGFRFLDSNQVWRTDGTQSEGGGTDWFESGIALQDAVLQELTLILYPEHGPQIAHHYFRNAFLGDPVQFPSPSECTDAILNAPLDTHAVECIPPTSPPPPTQAEDAERFSSGALAGGIIGGMFAGLAIALGSYWAFMKRPTGYASMNDNPRGSLTYSGQRDSLYSLQDNPSAQQRHDSLDRKEAYQSIS